MDRARVTSTGTIDRETDAPLKVSSKARMAHGHVFSGTGERRLSIRQRLSTILGALAVAGLLFTPVASAAPGQSWWEMVGGRPFNGCTNEYWDHSGRVHFVETASGPFHFNVHLEGVGESSGSRYTYMSQDNEFFHANPNSTYTIDQVLNFKVVSQGNLPNSWLTIRIHLVVDLDGTVISGRDDASFDCQGS